MNFRKENGSNFREQLSRVHRKKIDLICSFKLFWEISPKISRIYLYVPFNIKVTRKTPSKHLLVQSLE